MKIAITLAAAIGLLIGAPLAMAQQTPPPQQKKPAAAQQKPKPQQRVQQQAKPKPAVVQQRTTTRPSPNTRTRNVTTTTTKQNNKTNVTTTRTKSVTVTNNKPPRQVTFSSNRQTFAGTKARAWRNNGNWNYRGRNYSYWRGGPYRYRYNNTWRTYVALSALTAIAVGSATYYPYAYVSAPQEVCEGITEDGCQLTWTEAETLEGGLAPVCVTYCPWQ
jgi:hypothetical protein